jgi:hypothetical protein
MISFHHEPDGTDPAVEREFALRMQEWSDANGGPKLPEPHRDGETVDEAYWRIFG